MTANVKGTTFAIDLAKNIESAKEKASLSVRATAIDLFNRVIEKSPVGNPELWESNKSAVYARETYNLFVDAYNSDLLGDSANLTKSGNLKKGKKKAVKRSSKWLAKEFQLKAGKTYIGGRFRANWVLSFGSPSTAVLEEFDKTGNKAKERISSQMQKYELTEESVFLTNNLPYAERLEYGWSTQAPGGMVRLSILEMKNSV